MSSQADARGRFGAYGGRYVPETLVAALDELSEAYPRIAAEPGFRAELMRKDLRLSAGAMRDHGVFAPATNLAAQMLEALVATGRGGLDSAALGALVAELSGAS